MMVSYVIAKYIRLSLDDAVSDSMSIENQRLLLDEYILNLGIDDAEVIERVDNGYTGANFERPGIQELLELVRLGKVNCVIVKDFSRFGRDSIEVGYFIERVFPLFGVRFISVSDGFDSSESEDFTGGMEMAFKFLIHEQYSKDLSKKIGSAWRERALRGEAVSKNCVLGYMLDEKRRMVIDEPAAETVKMVFTLAAQGHSLMEIGKRLYAEKRATPGEYKAKTENPACHWRIFSIRAILLNEQYTGTYIAGKVRNTSVGGKQEQVPESEWIRIPEHHAPIVTRELFDKASAVVIRKSQTKRKREIGTYQRYGNPAHPLKRKTFCACCGHIMKINSTANPKFYCDFTRTAPDKPCHHLRIDAKKLSDTLYDILSEQTQAICEADNIKDCSGNADKHKEVSELDRQLYNLNDEKHTLYERLMLEEITAETYRSEKAGIEIQIKRLAQVKDALGKEAEKASFEKQAANERLRMAEMISEADTLTQELADMFIERVSVLPDMTIEVVWKHTDYISKATA